jgi:hypothetical protein
MKENFEDVIFYYLRDRKLNPNDSTAKKGVPIGVVAVRENEDGTVNRGVSICSRKDRYDKNAGRGIALKRLITAETICRSIPFGEYVGDEDKKMMRDINFKYHTDFHAEITPEEYRMFHKPENI